MKKDQGTDDSIESKHGQTGDGAEQARLHVRAGKTLGAIAGNDRKRAEHAKSVIRKRLQRRDGR